MNPSRSLMRPSQFRKRISVAECGLCRQFDYPHGHQRDISLPCRNRTSLHPTPFGTMPFSATEEGQRCYGWAGKEYVLINPDDFAPDGATPVYAISSGSSKRVGLIGSGTIHPIIGEFHGFLAASLRGGSGFAEKPWKIRIWAQRHQKALACPDDRPQVSGMQKPRFPSLMGKRGFFLCFGFGAYSVSSGAAGHVTVTVCAASSTCAAMPVRLSMVEAGR